MEGLMEHKINYINEYLGGELFLNFFVQMEL